MSLRVAITRALPDAEDTAARIRARGGEPIITPLLAIEPRAFDADVAVAQALLFTSAAAVRAFSGAQASQSMQVLAVGDATAAAARAAGFGNVQSADGDAVALAKLAIATLDPKGGPLIHIRGEHVAGDVAGQLEAASFIVDRRIAYTAARVTQLPPALAGAIDIVLFYSARAAEAFTVLGGKREGRIAACLSQAVANAAGAGWKGVIIASKPREDALLDAVFRQ